MTHRKDLSIDVAFMLCTPPSDGQIRRLRHKAGASAVDLTLPADLFTLYRRACGGDEAIMLDQLVETLHSLPASMIALQEMATAFVKMNY